MYNDYWFKLKFYGLEISIFLMYCKKLVIKVFYFDYRDWKEIKLIGVRYRKVNN